MTTRRALRAWLAGDPLADPRPAEVLLAFAATLGWLVIAVLVWVAVAHAVGS